MSRVVRLLAACVVTGAATVGQWSIGEVVRASTPPTVAPGTDTVAPTTPPTTPLTTPPTTPRRPVSELPAPQPLESSTGQLPPLIPIPAGCPTPLRPTAVFVGKLVENSSTAARFEVERIRAGTLKDFTSGRLVDVIYVQETRFLHVGQRYVVGVGSSKGRLVSKVRAAEPKFGGSAVISVNDTDIPCPATEDPIRTLLVDGRPVESGVFSELTGDKVRLAKVFALPFFIGLALLAGMSLLKETLGVTGRGLRSVMDREATAMRRSDAAPRPRR